jgi:hypothetical protein
MPPFESMPPEADKRTPCRKRNPKLSTYQQCARAMPWALANATQQEEASPRATAPRLLGVIQDRVWEPGFARVMARLCFRHGIAFVRRFRSGGKDTSLRP